MYWGFDFGKTTGYAVVDAKGALLEESLLDQSGAERLRYHRLFRKLSALQAEWGTPSGLAYERGGWTNTIAAVQHGGYYGCIMAFAVEVGAAIDWFAPSTLKKRAAGHGRADKESMVRAFVDRWGFEPMSHDSADAAHAAWCMQQEREF